MVIECLNADLVVNTVKAEHGRGISGDDHRSNGQRQADSIFIRCVMIRW
jgi:hypothetical protein